MIFLLLAILSSSMISIVMRLSTNRISANLSMVAANYLVCSLLGAAYAGFDLIKLSVPGFSVTLGLGLVSGVLYMSSLVMFQSNTRTKGVVLSSVFMKLGLLVPIVMSVLLFGEVPTPAQTVGFCIAVFAIVLMNMKKESSGRSFGAGLIVMLLLSGGADVMAKIFDVLAPAEMSALYLFYNFATAFALCVLAAACKKERPGLAEIFFGTLMGIPNFFSAKFLLSALTKLPAVVVYPSFSVATMLIVTLTGIIAFRERLTKVQWIALTAIIVSLVLLNI